MHRRSAAVDAGEPSGAGCRSPRSPSGGLTYVGYFPLRTALDYDPRSAVGIDGALARVQHEPNGSWLVGLVAIGLLVFAAFSLFEARCRRL